MFSTKKVSTQRQRSQRAFKQRRLPNILKGMPGMNNYAVPLEVFFKCDATIQPADHVVAEPPLNSESVSPPANFVHPRSSASTQVYDLGAEPSQDAQTSHYCSQPFVVSEAHPSSLHSVNLNPVSPQENFVHPRSSASTRLCLGAGRQEPSQDVPPPFLDLHSQTRNIFSLKNNSCQSYADQCDSSCHSLPPSSSNGSMEYAFESSYQQWPYNQSIASNRQPFPASSTFPGNWDNGSRNAEIAGSPHSMMTSANYGTETTSSLDLNNQKEIFFPLTNNPCQSYAGQCDSSCHSLPPSSSNGSMEYAFESSYQQWPYNQSIASNRQPFPASSTFPGNWDYAEIAGFSQSMRTSANDGTGPGTTLLFPNYDNDLHSYDG